MSEVTIGNTPEEEPARGQTREIQIVDESPLQRIVDEAYVATSDPQQVLEEPVPAAKANPTPEELEAELTRQLQGNPTEVIRIPELDEQPADEVFAGEFKPNLSVDEVLPILEELSEERVAQMATVGSILLPNASEEELTQIYNHITRNIINHQATRHQMVKEGRGDHLYGLDVDKKGGRLYVTEKERQSMAIISEYRSLLRTGMGETLFAEGEVWTNMPKHGDAILAIGKNNAENSKDPLVKMRGQLGLSGDYPAPMWGTGLHLKLNSPGAQSGLRLETKLLLEKIDSSRDTMGYALSAPSVFMNIPVIDYILDHVLDTTLGSNDVETLKNTLLLTDLECLAGASASTIHPDGFMLERPCLKSNGGCGHVTRRLINIRRQMFVRWERLSEHQKQFMTKRSGHVDPLTIRGYQSQTRPEISRFIDIGNGYFLKLQVPTIARYERLAGAWMGRLTTSAKDLIVSNADRGARETYLERSADIALIMAFGHWVEAFVYRPGLDAEPQVIVSRTVDDPDKQYEADMKVDKQLEDLSADGGQTRDIVAQIKKFIDDMTVGVFAVPKTICAGCGQPVTGDDQSKHPHLVQINAVELFFTLLRHKTRNSGK